MNLSNIPIIQVLSIIFWILFIIGFCLIIYWVFDSKINGCIRRLIELIKNEEQSKIISDKIIKILFSIPQIIAFLWILFIGLLVLTGATTIELTNLIWITVALTIWPALELLFSIYIAITHPKVDKNAIKDKKCKIKFYAYYASFFVLVWVASRFKIPETITPQDGILTLVALIIFTNEIKDIMINRESIKKIDYRIKLLLLAILIIFGAFAFYHNVVTPSSILGSVNGTINNTTVNNQSNLTPLINNVKPSIGDIPILSFFGLDFFGYDITIGLLVSIFLGLVVLYATITTLGVNKRQLDRDKPILVAEKGSNASYFDLQTLNEGLVYVFILDLVVYNKGLRNAAIHSIKLVINSDGESEIVENTHQYYYQEPDGTIAYLGSRQTYFKTNMLKSGAEICDTIFFVIKGKQFSKEGIIAKIIVEGVYEKPAIMSGLTFKYRKGLTSNINRDLVVNVSSPTYNYIGYEGIERYEFGCSLDIINNSDKFRQCPCSCCIMVCE